MSMPSSAYSYDSEPKTAAEVMERIRRRQAARKPQFVNHYLAQKRQEREAEEERKRQLGQEEFERLARLKALEEKERDRLLKKGASLDLLRQLDILKNKEKSIRHLYEITQTNGGYSEWRDIERSERDEIMRALSIAYRINMVTVIRRICAVTKVTPSDVFSAKRSRHIAFTRHAISYWTARLTGLSFPQIAYRLGGRDHTTILSSVQKYPQLRAEMGRNLRDIRRSKTWNKKGDA